MNIPSEVYYVVGGGIGFAVVNKTLDFVKWMAMRNINGKEKDTKNKNDKPGHSDSCKRHDQDIRDLANTLKEHDRDIAILKTLIRRLPEMEEKMDKNFDRIYELIRKNNGHET
jgi:Lhr-like helicase